ncbi:GIN domain-containing protein [Muriicola marianensis]|uniref:Putative auto-transporter adhesin head GIN domain-containing protein n=1 Tax=Muriicola marianensis TaxID=1324801 RepID=A0ABQ1QWZ1_9FLAO|nr:DUF2807 domain-containing protein [Muriicola marianensis]GGD46426.1 hypothetical protein GCM10011361_11690 [Muriicola marianensis]
MKIALRYLLITLVFTMVTGVYAQRKPRLKGNREVTTVTEALPPFSRLELVDDLDIVLKRSAEESYTITADDNLVDVIKFRVNDGTLVISSFYEITSKKELTIVVSFSQLNTITVQEGRVETAEGERINTDALQIETFGNSRVHFDGDVGTLTIAMKDNSKGEYTMTADSLSVKMSQKSDAQLYVNAFSGSVDIQDNSSLQLEGTSGSLDMKVSGNGKLRGQDFEVDDLTAGISDSGDARIFARTRLQIGLTGNARCYLFSEPDITLTAFRDNSEFFKRNK